MRNVTFGAFAILTLFFLSGYIAPAHAQGPYQGPLLVTSAGQNTVRLLPPLVIEREHIDFLVERLEGILEGMGKADD